MKWFLFPLLLAFVVGCGGGNDANGDPTSTSVATTAAGTSAPAAIASFATETPTGAAQSGSTAPEPAGGQQSVLDILASDERFTTFYAILQVAPSHFTEFMAMPGWNHTLLVPTDEAFDALPAEAVEAMRAGQVGLIRFLDHLILPAVVPVAELEAGQYKTVGQGGAIEIAKSGNEVTVDAQAAVLDADIEAANGLIHVLDTVIGVDYILRAFD